MEQAFVSFGLVVNSIVCADLGCSTGGFTDCLLQHGAARVYAVDTGYGVLDWKLRNDPRVIARERTNAMHVELPEPMNLVTIDVAWTRQRKILPAALRLLSPEGRVVSLIKPHYEAPAPLLRHGILPPDHHPAILAAVRQDVEQAGFAVEGEVESPIKGAKGNTELLWLLLPRR